MYIPISTFPSSLTNDVSVDVTLAAFAHQISVERCDISDKGAFLVFITSAYLLHGKEHGL
jgi:hypothetical protein